MNTSAARIPFRKDYEVVGYAADGAAWCATCATNIGLESFGDASPIFLSDATDTSCDACFAPLED